MREVKDIQRGSTYSVSPLSLSECADLADAFQKRKRHGRRPIESGVGIHVPS